MKAIITALITSLFALSFACAQVRPAKKPLVPPPPPKSAVVKSWFGIFAGPNLNYLAYHDKFTTIQGTNESFHAGVFFQRNISKWFALQPSVLFSIRGGKISDIDSTTNAKLANIELPINFLYLYKRLTIGAGPSFCYGISGKLKTNGRDRNAYDPSESNERTLKRFELGGNFAIGYTFKKGIFMNANFSPGFTNIYKGDHSALANVRANTTMYGFSIGYLFAVHTDE